MGIINIEDVQVGMTLAGDVKDRAETVILSVGAEITDRSIRVFKAWGITEVDVEGVDQAELATAASARVDPVLLREAEASAGNLFRHADRNHPAMDRLYRIYVQRYVRQQSDPDQHGS